MMTNQIWSDKKSKAIAFWDYVNYYLLRNLLGVIQFQDVI